MTELSLLEKALLLKKTRIFCDLDFDIIMNIAEKTQTLSFANEASIFLPSHEASQIYFLYQGKVSLAFVQPQQAPLTLCESDHFGELAFFTDTKRFYEAKALSEVKVLTLKKPDFLRVVSEFPSVAFSLLREYAQVIESRI